MVTKEETRTVESWIYDLSKSLGVELILNDGICAFQVGDDTIITIEVSQDFPVVNFYSPLLPLPADNMELSTLMMAKSLEINAFQALTRGGAIATAPGGGFLIFCYSTPIQDIDSETFNRILGSFFETIGELKGLLSQVASSDVPMDKTAPKASYKLKA